jgi:putative zinc finger/helix-turn-helix YgiT family protein
MSEQPKKSKPFPWCCPHCGKKEVQPLATDYEVQVKHDGRLYNLLIEMFLIPTCRHCGERLFSVAEDERICDALRQKLNLLAPEQIRSRIRELGLSQKEVASQLNIAEETLSRWVTGTMIQSKAMDTLLRLYFDIPQVRSSLAVMHRETDFGVPMVPAE